MEASFARPGGSGDVAVLQCMLQLSHGAALAAQPETGVGAQGAFYHKASRTLMVTDAVVYVPEKPPEVRGIVCSYIRKPHGMQACMMTRWLAPAGGEPRKAAPRWQGQCVRAAGACTRHSFYLYAVSVGNVMSSLFSAAQSVSHLSHGTLHGVL